MAEGNKRKSGPPDGSNDHDARKKKRVRIIDFEELIHYIR